MAQFDAEHHVLYKAIADFSSLYAEIIKARAALKTLGNERGTLHVDTSEVKRAEQDLSHLHATQHTGSQQHLNDQRAENQETRDAARRVNELVGAENALVDAKHKTTAEESAAGRLREAANKVEQSAAEKRRVAEEANFKAVQLRRAADVAANRLAELRDTPAAVKDPDGVRHDAVVKDLRDAYKKLSKDSGTFWVSLTDLRNAVGDKYEKTEVTDALRDIHSRFGGRLGAVRYPTEEDRDAAVPRIAREGTRPVHRLSLDESALNRLRYVDDSQRAATDVSRQRNADIKHASTFSDALGSRANEAEILAQEARALEGAAAEQAAAAKAAASAASANASAASAALRAAELNYEAARASTTGHEGGAAEQLDREPAASHERGAAERLDREPATGQHHDPEPAVAGGGGGAKPPSGGGSHTGFGDDEEPQPLPEPRPDGGPGRTPAGPAFKDIEKAVAERRINDEKLARERQATVNQGLKAQETLQHQQLKNIADEAAGRQTKDDIRQKRLLRHTTESAAYAAEIARAAQYQEDLNNQRLERDQLLSDKRHLTSMEEVRRAQLNTEALIHKLEEDRFKLAEHRRQLENKGVTDATVNEGKVTRSDTATRTAAVNAAAAIEELHRRAERSELTTQTVQERHEASKVTTSLAGDRRITEQARAGSINDLSSARVSSEGQRGSAAGALASLRSTQEGIASAREADRIVDRAGRELRRVESEAKREAAAAAKELKEHPFRAAGQDLLQLVAVGARGMRDVARAGKEAEGVIAKLGAVAKATGTVLKTSISDVLESGAGGSGGSAGGLGNVFGSIGSTLSSAGKSITEVLGKLLSFRGLILAAAVAAGPLVAILGSLGAAALGAGDVLVSLSGVLAALPGLFLAGGTALGVLYIALNPVINAFHDYVLASKAVAKAQAQSKVAGSESQAASKALADQLYEEQRAQNSLNEARQSALRTLQDLRGEVDRIGLNEEKAIEAVKQAEANYRKALADPNSTLLQRQEALTGVKEAEFDLRDVRIKNQRTLEDNNAAEKKGVEGADAVVAAKHALTTATEAVTKAQKEQAAGSSTAATALQKYQDDVAKLSPQTQIFVKSVAAQFDAFKGLTKTLGDDIFGPVNKALGSSGGTQVKKFLTEISSLLGYAATAIGDVAAAGIKLLTGDKWIADLDLLGKSSGTNIRNLGSALISVIDAFKNIAVAAIPFTEFLTGKVEKLAKKFDEFTNNKRNDGGIKRFLDQTEVTIGKVGTAVGNLGRLFGGLYRGSQDFMTFMLDGLDSITAKWGDYGDKQKGPTDSLGQFLERTKPLLQQVGTFIGQFAKAFSGLAGDKDNISQAKDILDTLGTRVLPAVVSILKSLSQGGILSGVANAIGILAEAVDYLAQGIAFFTGLKGVSAFLSLLAGGFAALAVATAIGKFTGLTKLFGLVKDFVLFIGRGLFKGNLFQSIGDYFRDKVGGKERGTTEIQRETGEKFAKTKDQARGGTGGVKGDTGGVKGGTTLFDAATSLIEAAEELKVAARALGGGPAPGGGTHGGGTGPTRGGGGGSGGGGGGRHSLPDEDEEVLEDSTGHTGTTDKKSKKKRRFFVPGSEQIAVDDERRIAEDEARTARLNAPAHTQGSLFDLAGLNRGKDTRDRRARETDRPDYFQDELHDQPALFDLDKTGKRVVGGSVRDVRTQPGRRYTPQYIQPSLTDGLEETVPFRPPLAHGAVRTVPRDSVGFPGEQDTLFDLPSPVPAPRREAPGQLTLNDIERDREGPVPIQDVGAARGTSPGRGTGRATPTPAAPSSRLGLLARVQQRYRDSIGANGPEGDARREARVQAGSQLGNRVARLGNTLPGKEQALADDEFRNPPPRQLPRRLAIRDGKLVHETYDPAEEAAARKARREQNSRPVPTPYQETQDEQALRTTGQLRSADGPNRVRAVRPTPYHETEDERALRETEERSPTPSRDPMRRRQKPPGFLRRAATNIRDAGRGLFTDDSGFIQLGASPRFSRGFDGKPKVPPFTETDAAHDDGGKPKVPPFTAGFEGKPKVPPFTEGKPKFSGEGLLGRIEGTEKLDTAGEQLIIAARALREAAAAEGGGRGGAGGGAGGGSNGSDLSDFTDFEGGEKDERGGRHRAGTAEEHSRSGRHRRAGAAASEVEKDLAHGGRGRVGGLAAHAGEEVAEDVAKHGGGFLSKAGKFAAGAIDPLDLAGLGLSIAADTGTFGGAGSKGKQFGQAGGAILGGAGIGAAVGSIIPGVGTVIGGAIGGLAGLTYSLFKDAGLRKTLGNFFASIGGFFESLGKTVYGFFDHYLIKPMTGFFKNFLLPIVKILTLPQRLIFEYIVVPVMKFLFGFALAVTKIAGQAAGWVYNNIVKPILGVLIGVALVVFAFQKMVAKLVYTYVIKPLIGAFELLYNAAAGLAKVAAGWVKQFLIDPLVGFFKLLWSGVTAVWPTVSGWIDKFFLAPVRAFFTMIGNFFSQLPKTIKNWLVGLPGVGAAFKAGFAAAGFQSGGVIPGARTGVVDGTYIRITPGEYVVRQRAADKPGARSLLDALNNERLDPSQFSAGLNFNTRAPLPNIGHVKATAPNTTITTTNTQAGLTVGDITINNPVREKSDRSLRRSLQTLAYMNGRQQ